VLKKVTLKNFQKHQSLTIGLSPTVTTLVGVTDAGKSAIFRAVYWVAFNQPTGDAMIKRGKSCAIAKLVFDDCEVVRKKGQGTNLYILDGSKRKAFGAGKVPDDVAAAMRLDAVNFQSQHDPHFWISDSAGKVSKELNRVVDLEIIDSSLAAADSDLRKAKATREVCEERLAKTEAACKELAWVPTMSEDLDRIIMLDEQFGELQSDISALTLVLGSLEEAENMALEASGRHKAVLGVVEAFEACCRAAQERDALEELLEELADCEAKADIEVPDLGPLEQDLAKLVKLRGEMASLEGIIEDLEHTESELCERTQHVTTTAAALAKIKTCPLCENPL